jgi:Fic family protein
MSQSYQIPILLPPVELDTRPVLKALVQAHKALADLKGMAKTIPNQGILIDTLALQEAQASSEIENIVTTQDQVFQIDPSGRAFDGANQKEVALYRAALRCGFDGMVDRGNLLTNNTIVSMFQVLKGTTGGFRSLPGTELINEQTGKTVYTPPQGLSTIETHMTALEAFINADTGNPDPLIRMALIHHQFESIHPFPDGNGRVGRIINVLYLVQQGLLETPILYLSRYITKNKAKYYQLLQSTRETGDWEPWLLYMINGVAEISQETTILIGKIDALMRDYKHRIRAGHKIYSQELLNNLFRHPYTRIEYVVNELKVSRPTATRYLDELHKAGFLERVPSGRNVYYVNAPLVDLFIEGFR